MISWDVRRLLRAAVMLAWAGFLAYLWIGGNVVRYLGPRTYWVAIFGALTLGAAGLAQVVSARSPAMPPDRRELAGLALILVPIVVALAVPDAELGALAASRKSTVGAAGSSLALIPEPAGEVSFREIQFASSSQQYAASSGIGSGTAAELVGFVTHTSDPPPGGFELTRFYISCCAADAIPYSVTIEDASSGGAGDVDDTWLRVTGTLAVRGDRLALVADEIRRVEQPRDPYLY